MTCQQDWALSYPNYNLSNGDMSCGVLVVIIERVKIKSLPFNIIRKNIVSTVVFFFFWLIIACGGGEKRSHADSCDSTLCNKQCVTTIA